MLNLLGSAGLPVAIIVFLASAVGVVLLGMQLAKYGDALASLTGWGRLFVGSILVALATSLPELSNNITAVQIDNPALALGDVLGSNMLNILILAMVALVFGGKRFLQRVAPEQGYLILLAAVLSILAMVFAILKNGAHIWQVGVSSLIILAVYLVGMWFVYRRRPAGSDEDADAADITLRRAWIMFILVSIGVIVSGVLLAQSVDRIAHATGVSSGVLGILAVALVTSMPEVSATLGAARIGAADLGFAGVYGSCVFNITILAYADPFYRKGIVLNSSDTEHYIAGAIAIVLILCGGLMLWGRHRFPQSAIIGGLALMGVVYVIGAAWVAWLGAPDAGAAAALFQAAYPMLAG